MATRMGWARVSLAMAAALLLCQARAGAIEAKVEGGALKLSGGKVELSVDAAKGTVAVRCADRETQGKGIVLRLSPGEGGKTAVTDLGKAKPPVVVGADDLVAARVPFHRTLPLTGVALWDVGGGATVLPVPLTALGFPENAVLAGYDLAEEEFVGPIVGALTPRVNGGECKLVALGQAADRPVLLCTSRSLLGGGDDLTKLSWDPKASVLSGTSKVEKARRYELRIFAPPEPQRWVAEAATVADAKGGVTTDIMQTCHWLRIYIQSPEARAVSWQVKFARKPAREGVGGKVRLVATAPSPRRVDLACYGVDGAAIVRRSDGMELVCDGRCSDTTVEPNTEYTYSAHPLSWTGRRPAAVAKVTVKTPEPPPMAPLPTVYLSDLRPVKAVNGWNGDPRRDTSIDDNPIRLSGMVFKRGMGVHALSELVYKTRSNYKRFVATVGVDDEKDSGSVTFDVFADDKPLFKSGAVARRDPWKNIDVPIPKGTKLIRLVVGDAGDGIGCDHADWANAGFITEGEAEPE